MANLRIPTRIRHFPAFLTQNLQKRWLLRRKPVRLPIFHLCYFSCQSYFKYLYCALHSLTVHLQSVDFRVHIFNDEEQPLSETQIAAIQRLIPNAEVLSWPKSPGWGLKQVGSIWKAYERVAKIAHNDDIIARVDSDVFFFNDDIFRAAAASDADLIGDGHFDDFEHCQGGCYLFRASAVHKIAAEIDSVGLAVILADLQVVADDRATRYLTERLSLKTWMTWFIMFPDELRNAGGLNGWARWKFSCFHSINKDKGMMLAAYERELYAGDAPADYRSVLTTD
jgi:hypothetical protein